MLVGMRYLTREELDAGLDEIRRSPSDAGTLELIVRRPHVGEREAVDEAELDVVSGLVGDNWLARGYPKPHGRAHPDMQVTLTNARAVALVAQSPDRWALAGDQLYVDLDLGGENLPPGSRLSIGSAVLEITAEPHNGCAKFAERFGIDAVRWVNSPAGKALHLRGVNSKVVVAGTIHRGDVITTSPPAA
jgi:MOSC domain-containing protein YiiM